MVPRFCSPRAIPRAERSCGVATGCGQPENTFTCSSNYATAGKAASFRTVRDLGEPSVNLSGGMSRSSFRHARVSQNVRDWGAAQLGRTFNTEEGHARPRRSGHADSLARPFHGRATSSEASASMAGARVVGVMPVRSASSDATGLGADCVHERMPAADRSQLLAAARLKPGVSSIPPGRDADAGARIAREHGGTVNRNDHPMPGIGVAVSPDFCADRAVALVRLSLREVANLLRRRKRRQRGRRSGRMVVAREVSQLLAWVAAAAAGPPSECFSPGGTRDLRVAAWTCSRSLPLTRNAPLAPAVLAVTA